MSCSLCLCEIKNLFCFTGIFHTCVYVFVKCYRNTQVDFVVLISILATDRVVRLNLFLLGNVIVMGCFCKL